jgi:hypothetical protein
MTKTIRVENADNANFKVIVEVWDKGALISPATDDAPECREPDTLARTINLDYPTAMTPADLYLTSTRYLVVKEA